MGKLIYRQFVPFRSLIHHFNNGLRNGMDAIIDDFFAERAEGENVCPLLFDC